MNPNIALSFQRPRFDPGEGQRNALAMRQAQMQEAAGMMQLQNAVEDRQLQAAQRNALAGADFSTPEGLQRAAAAAGQSGNVDLALKLTEAYQKSDEAGRARLLGDIELFTKAAPGLMNPETYEPTYAMLAQNAPGTVKGLPPAYDERYVPFIEQSAMGVSEWRAAQDRERTYNQNAIGKTTPFPPEVAAQRRAERAAGASQTHLVNYGDREADKLDAKYFSELYQSIQGEGRASEKLAMDYKLIDQLIGDAYSGAAANQVQSVKKLGRILGLDLGDVSGPEAAAVVSNQLALKLRSPEGGAGMPGAMSEKDREFLIAMVPGLATTKEGRQLMAEVQKRIAKRNQEVAKFARDYRLKNKYLDINFEQAVADRFSGKDIFAGLEGRVPVESAQGPAQIRSDADYDALPSGAEFVAPDGTTRVKP